MTTDPRADPAVLRHRRLPRLVEAGTLCRPRPPGRNACAAITATIRMCAASWCWGWMRRRRSGGQLPLAARHDGQGLCRGPHDLWRCGARLASRAMIRRYGGGRRWREYDRLCASGTRPREGQGAPQGSMTTIRLDRRAGDGALAVGAADRGWRPLHRRASGRSSAMATWRASARRCTACATTLPTWRGHNEQTMAHAAIAYAKAIGSGAARWP
jgi:hypothetical protein